MDILENFDREGWHVASATQVGRGLYSKHELRLRNGQFPQVGDSLIEAIIRNSHDGTTTFSVSAVLEFTDDVYEMEDDDQWLDKFVHTHY